MSLLDADAQARIADYRQKAIDGTITLEETKDAVRLLREGRMGAQAASDKARSTRARKVVRSADEMLDGLGL